MLTVLREKNEKNAISTKTSTCFFFYPYDMRNFDGLSSNFK